MATTREARRIKAREDRRAKEDAEHAALNALLEEGKFSNCNSVPVTIS